MPALNEPWWVCRCGEAVAKVGSKSGSKKKREHQKVCERPGYSIVQIPQAKGTGK